MIWSSSARFGPVGCWSSGWHQDLWEAGESSRGEGASTLGKGTGRGPFSREGNWKRGAWLCSWAGLRGPTGLRLDQKWILESRGLGASSRPDGVCAVRKAGVRDPEGSAGLLRAMETRSLPVRRREGEEISKLLGFLPFSGVPLASPLLSGVVVLCDLSLSL